jgi:hypothetical protein
MKNQFELFCFYGIFSSFEINERVGLANYKYIFGRRFPSSLRQIEKIVLFDETKIEFGSTKRKNSFVRRNENRVKREKKQKQKIQWARLIGSRFYPEKQKKKKKILTQSAQKPRNKNVALEKKKKKKKKLRMKKSHFLFLSKKNSFCF